MITRAFVAGVALLLAGSTADAATKTWTGTTSALWSVGSNWGGLPPADGDDLVFPAAASNKTNTNDLAAGTSFNSIMFSGDGYFITGNGITLGSGGIIINMAAPFAADFNVNIGLPGPRPITFAAGVSFLWLRLGGVISGGGGWTIATASHAWDSQVDLKNANTYSGGTTVNGVYMAAVTDASFGTGPITNVDGTLVTQGHTIANALSIQGFGQGSNGTVNDQGTWTGPVTLTGNAAVGSNSIPSLTFSGPISGNSFLTAPLNHAESVVVLSGSSPLYSGTLTSSAGTLLVNGSLPNAAANLTAGTPSTLGGTGTIGGAVILANLRHLAPGVNGPGIFNTGNLFLGAGSIYDAQLNGATLGSGYDQINVTGTVSLGGMLKVTRGFVPPIGSQYTIINNDGADAVSGTFTGLPEGAQVVVGGARFRISYVGGSGNDVVLTAGSSAAQFDFDGDFKTDRTLFRPSTGVWYSALSNGGATTTGWGLSTDADVAGDYDGDGKTDLAVWRPSSGVWFIVYSSDGSVHTMTWGTNGDLPLAGDVDGDGKSDFVVFRASAGAWFLNKSGGGTTVVGWGISGDQGLLGDFDGDGKMDVTVFRPSSGVWYSSLSGGGSFIVGWGTTNDIPVIGDWDSDGIADATVFRPSTGTWFVRKSTGGTLAVTWGVSGDIPASGDWDADGKSDYTVWRPTTGVWFTQLSGGGSAIVGWGITGDKPVGRLPGS